MAKGKAKTAGVAPKEGGSLPAVFGFSSMALPMAGLIVTLWTAPLPQPFKMAEGDGAHGNEKVEVAVHYVDLPEPLTVATAPGQPRVQITLAVAIKGNLLKLAGMEEEVLSKAQRITAAMLGEAQKLMDVGADSDAMHRELPERLRKIINGAIGTEDWPEPVVEVLITSLAIQG